MHTQLHISSFRRFILKSFLPLLLFHTLALTAQEKTTKQDNYGLRGVQACPLPRTFVQPDGNSFQGKIVGNMSLFYVETLDGYTILQDKADGFYKYAVSGSDGDLFLTNTKVSEVEKRSSPEKNLLDHLATHARYQGAFLTSRKLKTTGGNGPQLIFPSTGTRKALMILMEFPDQAHTYTTANVDSLLNQPGYNVNGQSGSFRDYYLAASYGTLTINADVEGWYTAPSNKSTYGYSNGFTAAVPLIRAAVDSAEAHGVNFAQYDGDNDGSVDVVMVLHSGRGAEESGNNNDIWSHRWALSGASLQVTYDGKLINDYIIQAEKFGTSSITNIGVVVHEFGHAMGLPDLYDTDGSSSGLGNWCVMSGGSWNNSGKTPAQLCGWCKKELGWITPTVLTGSGHIYNLKNLNDSAIAYRLNTTNPLEYFLVENRQNVGWDSYLPGNGLCVFHIDESQPDNTDETHFMVGLVQADGLNQLNSGTNGGDAADPFPGTQNKTTFNCATFPNSNTYLNAFTNINIDTITNSSSLVSFYHGPCGAPPIVVNDSCANATVLTLNAPAITATNVGATDDVLPAASCGATSAGRYNGVWFKFTAPYTGNFTVSTCPYAGNDIYARVYSGSCSALTCVGYSDDDCSYAPEFAFPGTANTDYYILVGNYYANSATGTFPMSIFTPLRIKLDKIEAANIGSNRNRISWNSLEESAGDYYELERSADGKSFEKIAVVQGKNKAGSYAITDENALGGMNYYRLKMLDQTKNYSYSKTVQAYVAETDKFTVMASPNPAGETLKIMIYGTVGSNAHLKIMDVTGKLIKTLAVVQNEESIDLKNMSKGVYLIKYEDSQNTQTLRITKD